MFTICFFLPVQLQKLVADISESGMEYIFLYFSPQGCYTVPMNRIGPGPNGQKNRERGRYKVA